MSKILQDADRRNQNHERLAVTFRLPAIPDAAPQTVQGRDAWALLELLRAGPKGVTPIDVPGPRWSGYVHKLRKRGVRIETIDETHDGPFPGRHARYRLVSVVQVLDGAEGRAAA